MEKVDDIYVKKIYPVEGDLDFYRDVMANMHFPVLVCDENGKFVFANRAALLLTGYSEAEIKSMTFDDLFPTESGQSGFEMLKNQSKLIECRINIKHQEGKEIPAKAKIKGYGSGESDRRRHFYEIILHDLYMDLELEKLKKPLLKMIDVFKAMRHEIEEFNIRNEINVR